MWWWEGAGCRAASTRGAVHSSVGTARPFNSEPKRGRGGYRDARDCARTETQLRLARQNATASNTYATRPDALKPELLTLPLFMNPPYVNILLW